jgi:Domain of unknown function (DUF4189)
MRQYALGFVICVATLLSSRPCMADGALAIGIPPGGVIKGFAAGHSTNDPDMKTARENAMISCAKVTNSNAAAIKACGVVATFRDQCYAIALDPKDGTPGAGWAVAETLELAKSQAMQQCRNTAGASRAQFCKVEEKVNHGCDGKAK